MTRKETKRNSKVILFERISTCGVGFIVRILMMLLQYQSGHIVIMVCTSKIHHKAIRRNAIKIHNGQKTKMKR